MEMKSQFRNASGRFKARMEKSLSLCIFLPFPIEHLNNTRQQSTIVELWSEKKSTNNSRSGEKKFDSERDSISLFTRGANGKRFHKKMK